MSLHFLKQFIKNPTGIGALFPVSDKAIRQTLKHINFNKDLVIVEYGAGPGNYTRALLERMSPGSRLISFEINKEFSSQLEEIQDERFQIVYESAEYVDKFVESNKVDVIVSTMPLTILDQELKQRIFERSYEVMKLGGIFLKIQYSTISRPLIGKYFNVLSTDFCVWNILPVAIMKFIK